MKAYAVAARGRVFDERMFDVALEYAQVSLDRGTIQTTVTALNDLDPESSRLVEIEVEVVDGLLTLAKGE